MKRLSICFAAFFLFCSIADAQTQAAPAAQPRTDVTSAESPAVRDFQKIEDNWAAAVNGRDQYGLELVLSPLYVDISATGDITSRNQQVAAVITGEDKTVRLDQRVVTVRMLGDAAVVNGTYTLHHKAGSAEVNEKGVFTQVFERSRGGWLCVNSQRTLLREDSNAKKEKKQSNAEAPFHIPLFTKGDKGPQ